MLEKILSTGIRNQRLATAFLIATHIAGAIGLIYEPTRSLFQNLTPLNLLVTAAIIFHFEKEKTAQYFIFIIATFLIGFFAEVLGVKTGMIFGDYAYGETLGIKVLNVPLSIGLNWAILIYIAGIVSNKLFENFWLRISFGSILMVLLDFLIEPVAIDFDFWTWNTPEIPIQNYIGWFILSLLLHSLFQKLNFGKTNPLAIKLLIIQFSFFAVLNLFY
uniref:carotenoid biosynthesis protein n=2 Tax=Roseivirga sp. TaxID=1964215 RepID=UPI004047E619